MTRTDRADPRVRMFADMVRIRRLEERCAELYTETKIRGFLHLYVGEEAVAAGVLRHLGADDALVATYREHAHALLKGTSAASIVSEMYGRWEGCSHGRGGSMHLFDAEHRVYGGNAIVGGGLPMAVGLALADRMQDRDRVTACFFGEGATAEGEFHEAMNLAALWQVPILLCCENNLYAMGTELAHEHASTDLALRAASYGVPALAVDGMDPDAVSDAARHATTAIRGGGGPQFLELRTYRFRAHSMFDPERYRDKEEVARWKERDPLVTYEARLRADGLLDDGDVAAIETAALGEVEGAVAAAESGTWEPVENLTRWVMSDRTEEVVT